MGMGAVARLLATCNATAIATRSLARVRIALFSRAHALMHGREAACARLRTCALHSPPPGTHRTDSAPWRVLQTAAPHGSPSSLCRILCP